MATRPEYMRDALPARPSYMSDAIPAEEAREEPQQGGFLGSVGDWLVDNAIGGVSEDMLENARSGVFAQDAARDEGFLDRSGSLLERGGAMVDQGLYNFLGGLGSEKAREAASLLEQGTTSQDVAGQTTWDQAQGVEGMGRFITDAGIESLPAMGALAVPYAGPAAIATSMTGNIASDRAANDGRDTLTGGDLVDAAPWGIASTALDRVGLKGITNPVGNTVAGRIAGAGVREGATEGVQSQLEYAGGTLGTDAGWDAETAASQLAPSIVAGTGIGGIARGGGEIVAPAANQVRIRARTPERPAAAPEEGEAFEGSLDDFMRGENERPSYMDDAVPQQPPAIEMPEGPQGDVAGSLRQAGYSDAVVAGFLGNFEVEGGYEGAQGDGGTASGIAQWRGERRENFRQQFGKEPHEATPAEQARFVQWEMENPQAAGMTVAQRDAILAAQTPGEAAALIDQYYERSSGEHRARRIAAADGFAGGDIMTGGVTPEVPMPQRGEQPRIARIDQEIPEGRAGTDAMTGAATPVALPEDIPESAVEADGQATIPGIAALPPTSQASADLTTRRENFLSRYTRSDLAGNDMDNSFSMERDREIIGAALNGETIGDVDDAALFDMAAEIEGGANRQEVLSRIPGEMLRRVEMADKFVRTAFNARMTAQRARGRNAPRIKAEANKEVADLAKRAQALGIDVPRLEGVVDGIASDIGSAARTPLPNTPVPATISPDERTDQPAGQTAPSSVAPEGGQDRGADRTVLARGQLRGLGIAAELQRGKTAALVGRPVYSPKDLAEIAQVYRDPRVETFRMFFIKGNRVVHATGISSRMPGEAPLVPEGMTDGEWITQMRETMKTAEADGYYMLHNHPSGQPQPSKADRDVTREITDLLPGFLGHVVINSGKYSVINDDGRSSMFDLDVGEDTLIKPSVPNRALGQKITSDIQLAVHAKQLQKPGYATVIGTDAEGRVRVIVEYPEATLKRDVRELMATARRIQRQSGSVSLMLVGRKSAIDTPVVKRALRGGALTAAIDENSQTITPFKGGKKEGIPASPGRYVAEETEPFQDSEARSKLVDKDGIKRDAELIRSIVGNPVKSLSAIANSSMADMYRSFFYSMDARTRAYADRFNSPAISKLADMFHAEAGKTDNAVSETYHEAVEREGFGRASRAFRTLAPYFEDKAAMNRIGLMLRDPTRRQSGAVKGEVQAAADIAKLLKDTIDYRKKAGEDIGEVTDGYFPRWMDVEKVMKRRDLFLRNATELYRKHGAENPEASAEAWLARIFDQYAGLDGGIAYAGLFHDTRPAGVGRQTTKGREFGKDADVLLGDFYNNDTGEVLTSYFIGAARKAEESRRFGNEADGKQKLRRMMEQIKREVRNSDEDAGDVLDDLANIIDTNLGRVNALPEKKRAIASVLHTAGQLGTLDRATITSLSEAMMGFVRAGPRYGIPMIKNSVSEFVRQVRGGDPSDIARLAEALGIIEDVMVGDTLAARAGFERSQTTTGAAKVQRGFFRATGLHQWTEGTRAAAAQMGQAFLRNNAADLGGRKNKRAAEALRELGISDPKAFAEWLAQGDPTIESLTTPEASPMAREYRTALMRFVNQTIMKPTRAQKPKWASTPYGALVFSLMSFSYGFKKNVLDRTGRMTAKAIKEGDPTLLYPALGLAGLLAAHTVINNVLRQAFFGGGREEDDEGISFVDVLEAADRAGLTGAASRPLNALLSLRYRQGIIESMMGPVIGRPAELIEKTFNLATDTNSENTNTAERAAAGAIYDVVLEPALEAYGVTRFKGPLAAGIVWGSGNREGGVIPPDRDWFVDAVAGEKEE